MYFSAGFVLGQACLFDRKNATQTQSYGPEARGGACHSDVVISDDDIDYPNIIKPDILVVMSQDAYNKYVNDLKKGGILIIDSKLVEQRISDPTIKIYEMPLTETAEKNLGNSIVANVVMLGALIAVTNIVSTESLKKSIVKRWPRFVELNFRAFQKGMDLEKDYI
ncbi:unnamed protein product [marine sediment metagenome]|uniref:Pyruvate/ketoisovalerate oxidoreductase catalytic domain-containing protein n=1 Tax=marine sediment metagenome TaxID=412755 RepID=X1A274_9ZZZZ